MQDFEKPWYILDDISRDTHIQDCVIPSKDLRRLSFFSSLWSWVCANSKWRLRQSGKRLECSRYESIIHIQPISKVWFQQYVNWELPDVQAEFQRGRGTRDQIANIHWIIEKTKEFQKNIYFCFIDHTKAFDCVDHNKLWKILRDENNRPPYLPPEKPVCRTRSNG